MRDEPFKRVVSGRRRAGRHAAQLPRVAVEEHREGLSVAPAPHRRAKLGEKARHLLLAEAVEIYDPAVPHGVEQTAPGRVAPRLGRRHLGRRGVRFAFLREPRAERIAHGHLVAAQRRALRLLVEPLARVLPAHVHAREVAWERLAQMPHEFLQMRARGLAVETRGDRRGVHHEAVFEPHLHLGVPRKEPRRRVHPDAREEQDVRIGLDEPPARRVERIPLRKILRLHPAVPRPKRDDAHAHLAREARRRRKRVAVGQRTALRLAGRVKRHDGGMEEGTRMVGAHGNEQPVGPPLHERHRTGRGDAARRMRLAFLLRARKREVHGHNRSRLHVLQLHVVDPELRRVGRKSDAHFRPRRVKRRDERQRERVLAQFGDEADGWPRPVERTRRNRLTVHEQPRPARRLPHAHRDRLDLRSCRRQDGRDKRDPPEGDEECSAP